MRGLFAPIVSNPTRTAQGLVNAKVGVECELSTLENQPICSLTALNPEGLLGVLPRESGQVVRQVGTHAGSDRRPTCFYNEGIVDRPRVEHDSSRSGFAILFADRDNWLRKYGLMDSYSGDYWANNAD